jgi:hypothetical protein
MQRFQHQPSVANPDFELLRLEENLRMARERLARISRAVTDAAALKAVEDLCAAALAAVVTYKSRLP